MALEGKARAKFLVDAERCIECNACVKKEKKRE